MCHSGRNYLKFTPQCLSPQKVVSSNTAHGEVYSLQHYVIKVCQWLVTGLWFFPGILVSATNKTDHHDITEPNHPPLFEVLSDFSNIIICLPVYCCDTVNNYPSYFHFHSYCVCGTYTPPYNYFQHNQSYIDRHLVKHMFHAHILHDILECISSLWKT